MTTPDATSPSDGPFRKKALRVGYLVMAAIATVGWAWLLGYLILALLGY